MTDLLIVSLHRNECFTTCKPEDAEKEIERAKKFYEDDLALVTSHKQNYPDNADYWQARIEEYSSILKSGFEAITFEEYVKREREIWLSKEPKEITLEEWDYALNVLPPKKWIRNERYSQFFIGECTTMTFYGQYIKDFSTGKCYYALADVYDESTWLDKMLGLV